MNILIKSLEKQTSYVVIGGKGTPYKECITEAVSCGFRIDDEKNSFTIDGIVTFTGDNIPESFIAAEMAISEIINKDLQK